MALTAPKIVGFLCERGAWAFYEVSNPVRRELPPEFMGLPVHSILQVQMREILKAFLSGAAGVLLAGCEHCVAPHKRPQFEREFLVQRQALRHIGIDPRRVRLEWIAAHEKDKFIRTLHELVLALRRLPALRLAAETRERIEYCG